MADSHFNSSSKVRTRWLLLALFVGLTGGFMLYQAVPPPPESSVPSPAETIAESKTTPPHTRDGAATRSRSVVFTPPDARPDETVLVFRSPQARAAFLAAAAAKGVSPLGMLEALNAVRMRTGDLAELDTSGAQMDFNYIVLAPEIPEARSPDGVTYAAFGADALKWLGAEDALSDWGRGVLVAVLDTGIDPASPAGQRLAGLLDLMPDDNDDPAAWSGHGTAIASLLSGDGGNVQGIAPGASVLDVRVLSNDGVGDSFTLAKGIVDAVNRGARVLSMSLGSTHDSAVLRAAVEYAAQRNVVIVAAAGNEFLDQLSYPAAYESAISVGATDAQGQVPAFSNRGETLDLVAPGVGILTRWDSTSVQPFSGTSAAVPFVAGTVAQMISETPGMTAAQVSTILRQTTNDAGSPGADPVYGTGILNLQRLAERNQTGVYRVEVADHYLDAAKATGTSVPVLITVQNRGTEILENVKVQTIAGDKQWQGGAAKLLPGQSFGVPINLILPSVGGEGVRIESRATSTTPGTNTSLRSTILNRN